MTGNIGLAALSGNPGGIPLSESIGTSNAMGVLPQTSMTEVQEIGRLQTEGMASADQKPEASAQIVETWLSESDELGIEEGT